MTPVKCHSQPTPCAYKGALAKGSAPSTPARRYGALRRVRPAVGRGSAQVACQQDHERRAIPGVRKRTVGRGRQGDTCFLRSGPVGDCRSRPCGKLLRVSQKAGPHSSTEQTQC